MDRVPFALRQDDARPDAPVAGDHGRGGLAAGAPTEVSMGASVSRGGSDAGPVLSGRQATRTSVHTGGAQRARRRRSRLAEAGADAARDEAQADVLEALDGVVGRAAATGVPRARLEAGFAEAVGPRDP